MAKTATLSAITDAPVKDAVTAFCRRRGIKVGNVREKALIERLEDEIDLEAYRERRNEETFTLEEVLSGLNRLDK